MNSSPQPLVNKGGRPPGVPNKQAQEHLSFAPRSSHLTYLVKISPFIEVRPDQKSGRKLKEETFLEESVGTPSPEGFQTLRENFLKTIRYLINHGISLEKIAICPSHFYPKVSEIPVLYIEIREDAAALIRLRNQVNRYALHCYLEIGEIPPQKRSLLGNIALMGGRLYIARISGSRLDYKWEGNYEVQGY